MLATLRSLLCLSDRNRIHGKIRSQRVPGEKKYEHGEQETEGVALYFLLPVPVRWIPGKSLLIEKLWSRNIQRHRSLPERGKWRCYGPCGGAIQEACEYSLWHVSVTSLSPSRLQVFFLVKRAANNSIHYSQSHDRSPSCSLRPVLSVLFSPSLLSIQIHLALAVRQIVLSRHLPPTLLITSISFPSIMACSLVTSVAADQTSTSDVVDLENICLVPYQLAVVVDGSSPHPACTNIKLGSCIAGDLIYCSST